MRRLDKLFLEYEFKSDEDAVKMEVFYFIELGMMGRERRQYMNWTILSVIDGWEDFCSYDWGNMIFKKSLSSLQGACKRRVALYKKKHVNSKTLE